MGSTRLLGKVLKRLGDRPLLAHCVGRLSSVTPVVVATSTLPADDKIEAWAKQEGILCYRGSETDVLDRYYQTALRYQARHIIRATGDNPFVDPIEAARVLEYLHSHNVDYVTGFKTISDFRLPHGIGIEAFTMRALTESWEQGKTAHHREHVNEYLLNDTHSFLIKDLQCQLKNSCPQLNLTVDTPKEFDFAATILNHFHGHEDPLKISTFEIISWWKEKIFHQQKQDPLFHENNAAQQYFLENNA